MFRCTECGTEYEIKPDYCDCGNDVFEEVKPAPAPPKMTKITSEPKPKTEVKPTRIPTVKLQNSSPKPDKLSDFDRLKKNFDPISLGIFLFCIVLSLVILFFVGNPKESAVQNDEKSEVKTEQKQNIPSINSFWNNSTVGVVSDKTENNTESAPTDKSKDSEQTQPVPQQQAQQPQIIYIHESSPSPWPQSTTVPSTPSKPQTSITPAKTTQPVSKTAQTQAQKTVPQNTNTKQQTTSAPKTASTSTSNSTSPFSSLTSRIQNNITFNNNNQPKTSQTKPVTPSTSQAASKTSASSASNTATKPATANTQSQVQQTTKPAVSAPQPSTVSQVDPAIAKQELANYKVSLRNTIGRKIDFTKVVGDGDCAITFKIDSNGKLTNRAFAKQSSNITLNDAVYAAMMSTPSFNAPPSAYKNETLRLTVKFYNGNFTINLN